MTHKGLLLTKGKSNCLFQALSESEYGFCLPAGCGFGGVVSLTRYNVKSFGGNLLSTSQEALSFERWVQRPPVHKLAHPSPPPSWALSPKSGTKTSAPGIHRPCARGGFLLPTPIGTLYSRDTAYTSSAPLVGPHDQRIP